MIVVVCRAKVQPEKVDMFEATYRDLREKVRANEPGTVFYEILRAAGEPFTYRMVEAYAGQAAKDVHMAMDYYKEAVAVLGGCLESGSFAVETLESI